jgi:hypothetical protein
MYCPSSGTELTPELSYCNRCGANLKPISNQSGVPPAKLVGAAWAISMAVALVTLGGFGMIFALVMALVTRGINLSAGGMGLIFTSSLIILTIDWLLVRQLSRVLNVPQLSRLDNFIIHMRENMGRGALVVYGENPTVRHALLKRTERAKRYLVKERALESQRLLIIDGGYRDRNSTELHWYPIGGSWSRILLFPTKDPVKPRPTNRWTRAAGACFRNLIHPAVLE